MSQIEFAAAIADAEEPPRFSESRIVFTLTFFATILISFMAGYFIPVALDELLRSATASGAVLLSKAFGLNAFVEPGHIITIEGQRLSIVSECTAIGYIFIFAAAVIAYPSRGRKKLSGLFIGIPLLIALNLFRITMLGWVGGHYPAYFDLFHAWLWEGGFLLIVLLVWVGWVNSSSAFASPAFLKRIRTHILQTGFQQRLSLLLIAGLMSFFFSGHYQNLIAISAERLISLMGYDGVLIRAEGNLFVIAFSRHSFKEFWGGICYLVPFVALMLMFPRIGGGDKRKEAARSEGLFKLISGSVALTVIQLFAVLAFFMLVKHGGASWQLASVDTVARLSPAMIWFFLAHRRDQFAAGKGKSPSPAESAEALAGEQLS